MVHAPDPHEDDRATRDAILGGDREAAEALFRRHLDGLYEFVHYRVGGDRSRAEDIVQDTFLTAFERLASFDGRSSLHTWLCGIAKNKIRSDVRVRRPRPLADVLLEADEEIERVLSDIEREPLPDWILEREETRALVGATLSSLSPDHREALVGKYIDGASVRELSRRSGKSEKAQESTLTRARLAFSRVFQVLSREQGGAS